MKNLIVANWKMNPTTLKEAKDLLSKIKMGSSKVRNVEIVICPPFVFIPSLGTALPIGAQNIYFEDKGAYSGEVSALMLKDLKITYVIVGHSERRKYFFETDSDINKKIKKALFAKLNPIFCIGESVEERDSDKKLEILEAQIANGLSGVSKENIRNVAVAYEPVWAIGTGNNCSAEEAMSSVLFIRRVLSKLYNRQVADTIRILYGGSVKPENSGLYIKEAGFNGLLVGGASLQADDFIRIIKSAE